MNSSTLLNITKSPPSFNSISFSISFSCQTISSTAQEKERIERGLQESPYILNRNSIPFSMMELSYDSHVGPFLLLISSLSPVDE